MAKNGSTHAPYIKGEQASKRSKKAEESSTSHQLPQWIVIWFYVTALVCTWDASFIMCRPYSLPGQSMAWIWYLYKHYITVDQRYEDIGDAYIYAQSLLNYAEVVLNIIAIIMHYRHSKHTVPTAFMVSVMTMWKTVLYFLMFTDLCTGSEYRRGNTVAQEIFIMVIPNIIWIVLPTAAMVQLWAQLLPGGGEPIRLNTALNGEAKPIDEPSTTTGHPQFSKREVVRGPGSGLMQGGSSGIRQRVASGEGSARE